MRAALWTGLERRPPLAPPLSPKLPDLPEPEPGSTGQGQMNFGPTRFYGMGLPLRTGSGTQGIIVGHVTQSGINPATTLPT